MRWQTFVAPWLLAIVTAGHVGCSSVSGRPFGFGPTAATPAPENATPNGEGTIQRVGYIEERYREEYDPIKRPKADGLDAFKPESITAQVKDLTGTGPNAKVARELFAHAVVIGVVEKPVRSVRRNIAVGIFFEHKGFEKPRRVRKVPLDRTGVGHGLQCAVFCGQPGSQQHCLLADCAVAVAKSGRL